MLKVLLFWAFDKRYSYFHSCIIIFLICRVENQSKKAETQFFLAFLLAPFQSSWLRFYLVAFDLILKKFISSAMLIGGEIISDYVFNHQI